MHLFASKPGGYVDEEGVIDLAQSPADIIILSSSDSSLSALARAVENFDSTFPSIRLANWINLTKPAAYDLYHNKVLEHAKVVVVSLLGGSSYWRYGYEQLLVWASHSPERKLILVPGCDAPDDELLRQSSVSMDFAWRVWRYLREGGVENSEQLFRYLVDQLLDLPTNWLEPKAIPSTSIYLPNDEKYCKGPSLAEWRFKCASDKPVCLLIFYRSHLQGANTEVIDGLIEEISSQGLNLLPIAVSSLRDEECLQYVNYLIEQTGASLIFNLTAFAVNQTATEDEILADSHYCSQFVGEPVVLQLMLSSSTEEDWLVQSVGLRSRDLAMQVVLPETDGRIITRAIGFKVESYFSERCQVAVIRHKLRKDRAVFVAELGRRFCTLRIKNNRAKRIALILANYPNQDGRIGNGVGLDTPASLVNLLYALQKAGYPVKDVPISGNDLIVTLQSSITNQQSTLSQRKCWQSIDVKVYLNWFQSLPELCQQAVIDRWGTPDKDPKCRNNRLMISGIRLGEVFVGVQPDRGFQLDLNSTYHDPDLVPPHSYLAFYFWLREHYKVDAIIHVGKHGSLEWLPGKSNALSEVCWPDIVLGAMPHFYPFIVNDPGEGTQAKRRAQAVIVDHLMPPLIRSETYGELAELEVLVDEYYQALGMDPSRELWLQNEIIDKLHKTGVYRELGRSSDANITDHEKILKDLDAFLCDIKEAQIRNGLHILGQLPASDKLAETMVALLRIPRGAEVEQQGILNNLAIDLELLVDSRPFDPLKATTEPWNGHRPHALASLSPNSWRTEADTRERLELLAYQVMSEYVLGDHCLDSFASAYPRTALQCRYVRDVVLVRMKRGVQMEIQSILDGLSGRFVPAGPSGAPSRGRLDVFPTGRNFYSIDNHAIPSPAAWALGEKSAQALIERYLQDHGDFPRSLGLSIWGTATMRTGGDDIAQAFALIGVRPIWAPGSQRVIDIEVLPSMLLQRPRVDVTLRVSGFFRDAFPNAIRLFDMAVQAVANYEEPGDGNRLREHILERQAVLVKQGMDDEIAFRTSSFRVFSSKPGNYGVGINQLVDGQYWRTAHDLSDAYISSGGYAYGQLSQYGVEAYEEFKHQLADLDAVVQNQDNREHDILDSNSYYQFQGGMANATRQLRGDCPAIYNTDTSNPAYPIVRTLKEELNRVMRSRVLNPKWIGAMRDHGYKGAFEMAATIDFLFSYDVTTDLVDDYQYQKVADALIFDEVNQNFLRVHNRSALEKMTERMLEAIQRRLWRKPDHYAEALQDLLLDLDQEEENSILDN